LLAGEETVVDSLYLEACAGLLRDTTLDAAMVAGMLHLPSEDYLAELASQRGGANVDTLHAARERVKHALGCELEQLLLERYRHLQSDVPYAPDGIQIASRSLRNTCLGYLVAANAAHLALAVEQFRDAGNMTDRLAALREIAFYADEPLRDATLAGFYNAWRDEVLVVNQWLQLQAAIPDSLALSRVQDLLSHPDFDLHNPNKVRALVGGFANQNPINFHRLDGAGYRFLGDIVLRLNSVNPQIAARLLTPLTKWRNYTGRQPLMRGELERLARAPNLSPDVYEVVSKSLGED
jgi:aminopeptidase N